MENAGKMYWKTVLDFRSPYPLLKMSVMYGPGRTDTAALSYAAEAFTALTSAQLLLFNHNIASQN